MRNVLYALKVTVITLALPATALAQSSITGVARDTSGAILPGVTVETTSPALIEKARTAVTDGAGQYRIVDLPPGVYDVTFSLSGFKTVRREGIVLQGTFVAQVNGDLQVGTLEETIVVTGASPTVDVINNTAEFVADRDVLDSIPTAVRNTPLRALLLPGTQVTPFVLGQYTMSVHGSASQDTVIAIDGMRVNNLCGSGQFSGFYMNDAAIEEVTFTTGAESAEMQAGGLRINSTPKDGGNTFSGTFFLWGAAGSLQSDNRSDEVKAAGVPEPGIDFTYQINPSIGGPIVRDKLWFYFTYKFEDNKIFVASSQFAGRQPRLPPKPGQLQRGHPADVAGDAARQDPLLPRSAVQRRRLQRVQHPADDHDPEASTHAFGRGWVPQIKWSQTTTEQVAARGRHHLLPPALRAVLHRHHWAARPSACRADDGSIERCGGQHHPAVYQLDEELQLDGSRELCHRIPRHQDGRDDGLGHQLADLHLQRRDQPAALQQRQSAGSGRTNGPATAEQRVNSDVGVFVQDAWTMKRLTLNVGSAIRSLQCRGPRAIGARRNLDHGARLPGHQKRAELERLVGPHRRSRTTCSATARPR